MLSAYTRDNANVSCRLVAIVNPLLKSEADDIKWVEITHPDSLSYPAMSGAEVALTARKPVDIRETEGHIIKAHVGNVYDGKTYMIKLQI